MIELCVQLHDNEDVLHNRFSSKFAAEATFDDLKEKIHLNFQIEPMYQRVFWMDKTPINGWSSSTLLEIGLRNADIVVVKHSYIPHWAAYKNDVNEFSVAQTSFMKKYCAENAQEFLKLLKQSMFFNAYPALDFETHKLHQAISKYLDKRTDWIQNAATFFFKLTKFRGQIADVKFEETKDGTRSAVLCNVTVDSVIHKYRIKTNHNAGTSGRGARWDLDLIELFCYKFLESIGVGAKVLFIPNCVSSRSIIYIASELIPGFATFNSLHLHECDSAKTLTAIVQIYFLVVFLSLGDMHADNFGLTGSSPIIVDFMMSSFRDPKAVFLEENRILHFSDRSFSELLDKCSSAERLRIAKESLQMWDFEHKLNDVLKQMDEEKLNFGRHNLNFEKKTKELEEFVAKVKSDLDRLVVG